MSPYLLASGFAISAHNIILDRGLGHQKLIHQYLQNAKSELVNAPANNLTDSDEAAIGEACMQIVVAQEAVTKLDVGVATLALEVVVGCLESVIGKEPLQTWD